jgi:hypothetical protein
MVAVYEIPIKSGVPQKLHIALGGADYTLWLAWNDQAKVWVLDVGDTTETPMIRGIFIVTGCDLLAPYAYVGIRGQIVAQGAGNPDSVPGFNDLGSTGHLYYIF